MKKIIVIGFVVVFAAASQNVFAQRTAFELYPKSYAGQWQTPAELHAGIHSGSWTLKRQQILEEESKDPRRSCKDPYCQRCSKHLANYGHEYQRVGGVQTGQPFYGGTVGRIAYTTQRGYDEHSGWYKSRNNLAGVMYPEYQRYLNHAIDEQVWARNAVASVEQAESNLAKLSELRDQALCRAGQSEGMFHAAVEENGDCPGDASVAETVVVGTQGKNCCKKGTAVATTVLVAEPCLCPVCAARAQMCADKANLQALENGVKAAIQELDRLRGIADEAVRIAMLSKADADRATRFMRVHHKPPRWQESLAAEEAAAAKKAEIEAAKAKAEKAKAKNQKAADKDTAETKSEDET